MTGNAGVAAGVGRPRRGGLLRPRHPQLPRIWHTQERQGQILALFFRPKSLKLVSFAAGVGRSHRGRFFRSRNPHLQRQHWRRRAIFAGPDPTSPRPSAFSVAI